MEGENQKLQTKEACERNMDIVILKFEKALLKNLNEVTRGFEEALNCAKDKFAIKEDVDKNIESLKTSVSDINKKHEQRQYDWLKYSIVTAITIVASTLFNK